MNHKRMNLILASSSPYRRELLTRLQQEFEVVVPDVDESPWPGEGPKELAIRLAVSKAAAVASSAAPGCLVIGSDQVATLDGRQPIGKPGQHEKARRQLLSASGKACVFHTAVCVTRVSDGVQFTECIDTTVKFRELSDEMIETYLLAERPYDCAGAAKSEGLGISLISAIECADPTALIGLPLIALCGLLQRAGHPVLENLARC
ncbi:MAG: Maf family nucleotide pyrophosphatase [Burkholderiaceae bacterium]